MPRFKDSESTQRNITLFVREINGRQFAFILTNRRAAPKSDLCLHTSALALDIVVEARRKVCSFRQRMLAIAVIVYFSPSRPGAPRPAPHPLVRHPQQHFPRLPWRQQQWYSCGRQPEPAPARVRRSSKFIDAGPGKDDRDSRRIRTMARQPLSSRRRARASSDTTGGVLAER